jgi:hypothetical protein
MADHAWCSDPPRDAAVRAAEDGRDRPLPTLKEAIARAGQFIPPEAPQGRKCTERERQAASGGGEWEMSRAGQIESSDGTNTPKCPERDNLAASGVGEGEPVAWEYDIPTPHGTGRGVSNLDPRKHPEVWQQGTGVPATDARPLYRAPPQPRGWLTDKERESIDRAIRTVEMFDGFDRTLTKSLRALLARSSPPEVEGE